LWVFVALREGWRVPDEAIEFAVWLRATGRSRVTVFDDPEDDDDLELWEVDCEN
jgi:hypothetical protein